MYCKLLFLIMYQHTYFYIYTYNIYIYTNIHIFFSVFPAPVMFGGLMDLSCWQERPDPCGFGISGQGACLFYHDQRFRVNHHLLIAAFRLLSTTLYLIPWIITVYKQKREVGVAK